MSSEGKSRSSDRVNLPRSALALPGHSPVGSGSRVVPRSRRPVTVRFSASSQCRLALQLQLTALSVGFRLGGSCRRSRRGTLDLWSAELRGAKRRIVRYLRPRASPPRPPRSWISCSGRSGAKPGGCAPRPPATRGRGVSRPSRPSHWDADALRDVVRDYALEALVEPDAHAGDRRDRLSQAGQGLVRGGARQYTGTAGKITNCQVGVFAAYVSSRGHALVDRRLYLPRTGP